MYLKPLSDKIVVKPDPETKTSGGIILSSNPSDSRSIEGLVVAVGKGNYVGEKLIPCDLKVGQRVVYPKNLGIPVKSDGENYTILREHEILAVIIGV